METETKHELNETLWIRKGCNDPFQICIFHDETSEGVTVVGGMGVTKTFDSEFFYENFERLDSRNGK